MFRQLLFLMLLVSYVIVDSAITKINFDRKGIIKMSGAIPYLAKQAQKQILKKAITSTTGLDDFLGIKPLNENEDIVMNEYNRPNSPSQKNVSSWSEQDYYEAVNSDGFSQNYMLQNMCDEYLKLQNKR